MAGPLDDSGAGGRPARPAASSDEGEVIDSLRRRLVGQVRSGCPPWLADQAEDIVQTAVARVLDRRRRGGENPDDLASYLMRAAHNAMVDEIRRRFRRPRTETLEEEALPPDPAITAQPETDLAAHEIDRGIRQCLTKLSRPRRLAVTLYLLGHSFKEAASSMGWTTKRTEHLTYRGLDEMRRCLESKGLQP